MIATLEPLCAHVFLLRVHRREEDVGVTFCWGVTVVREEGDTALLKLAERWPSWEEQAAGEAALRAAGFKRWRAVVRGRGKVKEL